MLNRIVVDWPKYGCPNYTGDRRGRDRIAGHDWPRKDQCLRTRITGGHIARRVQRGERNVLRRACLWVVIAADLQLRGRTRFHGRDLIGSA